MQIDIILPIYNSPKETKACVESVIENTPIDSYRLFLLDDCSTDKEIQEITNYYSENHSNIFSFRNKANKGFPENVNNGFSITKNDVVILNSDTLVTSGWLQGLHTAALINKNVGAVGPLSNYGMISSVPSIYEEVNNEIDITLMSRYLSNSTRQIYHDTPVLTGFCMYLTRKAIIDVGLFDSETFQKGYGEEIDWCLRAREKGYRLLIAENTYVYHVGGVSFGNDKIKLQEKATDIINKRYPNYNDQLKKYSVAHPLTQLRKEMSKEFGVPFKYRARYFIRSRRIKLKAIFDKH